MGYLDKLVDKIVKEYTPEKIKAMSNFRLLDQFLGIAQRSISVPDFLTRESILKVLTNEIVSRMDGKTKEMQPAATTS